MDRHRLSNIQALRAIAVLLVVVRHVQVYLARNAGEFPVPGRFLVGDMGVDLFFVISGFVMVVAHPLPSAGASQVAHFLSRRVTRIYPLYWVYSLPALAIYLWKPAWLHRFDSGMQVHLVRSFLLWPQNGWPLLGQAWSLVYEMYFYLVFAGLLRLRGRWFGYGLLAWATLVLAGNGLLASMPALDYPETRLPFALLTLEFIAGALVGLAALRPKTASTPIWGWLLAGFAVAWIVGIVLPGGGNLRAGSRVLDYGLPSVALVYGVVLLENAGLRMPRFLAKIGDWSYSIYLSHIFVIAALARLVSPDSTRHPLAESFAAILCIGAVLLLGGVSYRYLERPLLRLTRQGFFPSFSEHGCHAFAQSSSPSVKRPLLILTPTLGTSPYLDETIHSIDELPWPIQHVLVCPADKIAELSQRFPTKRVVEDGGREGGLYGALNAGLAAANDLSWDWYTYLNDDDLLTAKFAEMLARHDARNDLASVAYGDVRTIDAGGASLGRMTVESHPGYFPALLQGGISPVGQQGMVFGAPVVRHLRGYDLRYSVCADLDYWARAFTQGFTFRYHQMEVGRFRVRPGQISGAVSLLSQQMEEITRRHFATPVSSSAKRFARWRYRCRNLPRYLERLRVVGLASSLEVLQAGGRRTVAKHGASSAASAP